ncbi:MAG: DUF3347 domain-containing protein [Leeuwenhoekiella sp.]
MKKLLPAALMFLALACGENKSKNPDTETVSMDMEDTESTETYTSAQRTVTFTDEKVAMLYDQYIDLKTALVNTDAKAAQSAAAVITANDAELELSSLFTESIQTISASTDIDEQREAFVDVTRGIKKMASENLESGTLYYQYCPMAFDGQGGYWLSNEEKIMNPYFGNKMLHCGTVEEEIN